MNAGLVAPGWERARSMEPPSTDGATCADAATRTASVVYRKSMTGSTMDDAVLWPGGLPHGTFLVAGCQQGGRGRTGRPWTSPPGHLYVTWSWWLPWPGEQAPSITLEAGLVVRDVAIRLLSGLPAAQELSLKWPNDLLVRGEKLAGVLCGWAGEWDGGCRVHVGLGLNVGPLTDELAAGAVSLHALGATRATVDDAITALLASASERFDRLVARGTVDREAWLNASQMVGRRVQASPPGQTAIEGHVVGLSERGELQVRPDGPIRLGHDIVTITAGDVRLLTD